MKDDYRIDNLLTEQEINDFMTHSFRLCETVIFLINSEFQISDTVEYFLQKNVNNYPKIKQEIIAGLNNFKHSENENNFITPIHNSIYKLYFKPIKVYNYLSGYFCALFEKDKIKIEKTDSIFALLNDTIKSKYEIVDLVKYGLTHYKQISLLSLISEGTLYAADLKDIYKKTLEIAVIESNAETGLIFSFEQESGMLELVYKLPETGDSAGYALFMDDNVIAKSVQNLTPIILNNINEDKDFVHPLPFLSPQNYLIVPLLIKTRVVGVIAVCDKTDNREFTSIDSQLLRAIGAQAAITIENLRLYFELKQNFIRTIEALTAAIDKKDKYTTGHSKRVSEIALIIAKQLNINDVKIREDIKIGALLHDIGKIAMPTDILFKPTKPTHEEWDIIRQHPEAGFDIVKSLSGFNGILPIIKHHHERWDGKGYPSGLKGEDIPIATRIVAVADAFDTIISKRPYKEAMTTEQAKQAIEKAAGTHFDAKVVDAFVQALEQGKVKVKENKNSNF